MGLNRGKSNWTRLLLSRCFHGAVFLCLILSVLCSDDKRHVAFVCLNHNEEGEKRNGYGHELSTPYRWSLEPEHHDFCSMGLRKQMPILHNEVALFVNGFVAHERYRVA